MFSIYTKSLSYVYNLYVYPACITISILHVGIYPTCSLSILHIYPICASLNDFSACPTICLLDVGTYSACSLSILHVNTICIADMSILHVIQYIFHI